MFGMIEVPAHAGRCIWDSDALCEKRRRLLHYRYSKENAIDYADTTHAYVGLAVLDWLLSQEQSNPAEAKSLWKGMFDTQFFHYLTSAKSETILFIGNLFGRFQSTFQDLKAAATQLKLFSNFSRLSGDVELLSACCLGLHLNNFDLKTCCDEIQKKHDFDVRSQIQN